MTRAAIYLRVSTDEQTVDNQRPELEQLARQRGWTIVEAFEEQLGAAKRRPELERLLEGARRGRFDVVLVWALDRLHRSMQLTISTVLELERRGVHVVSVREPWLDTGGPVRDLLLAIFGWVAQQERERLRERTRAGLERVRSQGFKLGRPPAIGPRELERARELALEGNSVRWIAARLDVKPTTLRRALGGFVLTAPPRAPKTVPARAARK